MNTLLEKINEFHKYQIKNYKKTNNIEIKFGRIISEELFSMKLKNTIDIIKNFRNFKLGYSQGKLYKKKNSYFKTFNNKNNEIWKVELLEKEYIPFTNFDLLIVNNLFNREETFPSLTEYDDEYIYDEVCVYVDKNVVLKFENYNDMFFLKICIELEKDLPYTYQDEIIKNISKILKLLDLIKCV